MNTPPLAPTVTLRHCCVFYIPLLLLITFILYCPLLQSDFIRFDDRAYVLQNTHIHHGLSLSGLRWALLNSHAANWHPVTWLSHMLDCELFGLAPGYHHLTNIILHELNIVCLFGVLYRMSGSAAGGLFVAALFALHPLNVETVAWVSQRKSLLSCFFGLLAVDSYISYAKRPAASPYVGVVLFFALSLMSKSMLVTLPCLLLLLDYWPLSRFASTPPANRRVAALVLEKLPLLAMSLAVSVIVYTVQDHAGAVERVANSSILCLWRADNCAIAVMSYLRQIVCPYDLSIYYPRYFDKDMKSTALASAVCILGACCAAIWELRRRPYIFVGLSIFLGMLFPVIGIVQVGGQAMANRYMYVPAIGIFAIIAMLGGEALAGRSSLRIVVGAVGLLWMSALAGTTAWYVGQWKDTMTLFRRALVVDAQNLRAHRVLGLEYTRRSKHEAALKHFEFAAARDPSPMSHRDVGNSLYRLGRYELALASYQRAARLEPDNMANWINSGHALRRLGRLAEATEMYSKSVSLASDDWITYFSRGCTWYEAGNPSAALDDLKQARQLSPQSPLILREIAWIMATATDDRWRNGNEALSLVAKAIENSDVRESRTVDVLAAAYAELGHFGPAIDAAHEAWQLAVRENEPGADEIAKRVRLFKAHVPYRFVPVQQ